MFLQTRTSTSITTTQPPASGDWHWYTAVIIFFRPHWHFSNWPSKFFQSKGIHSEWCAALGGHFYLVLFSLKHFLHFSLVFMTLILWRLWSIYFVDVLQSQAPFIGIPHLEADFPHHSTYRMGSLLPHPGSDSHSGPPPPPRMSSLPGLGSTTRPPFLADVLLSALTQLWDRGSPAPELRTHNHTLWL